MATVTFEPVNPTQVTIRPRTYKVDIGKVGYQGPPGPPGDITADQNVVWEVNEIFGTDARKYGTLSGTATENTATLNAALTDHANWSTLLLPQGTININNDLVFPVCSGKIVQGQGCNATASPSTSGTRIVQNGTDKSVFRLVGDLRALKFRDFSTAYATQQTSDNGKAHFLFDTGAGGTQHDLSFEHVTVERGHRDFYCPLNSSNSVWNLDFDVVRCWWTTHSVFELVGTGAPSNTFRQIFISNTPGGHAGEPRAPVPTGPALSLWNGEYTFDGFDVEGWDNRIYYGFGAATSIRGLHVEHHTVSGAGDAYGMTMFVSEGGPLDVQGWIYMDVLAPGSFSATYMTVFKAFGNNSSVSADHLVLAFNTNLAGEIAILDGDILTQSYIGPDISQVGTKTLTDFPPSTFWPTSGYRAWNAQWVTPALATGWTAVPFYQPPRYRRVGYEVIGEGIVQNTSGGNLSTPPYVLPVGLRPPTGAQMGYGYGAFGIGTALIETNGNVGPVSPVADDGLFNMQFRFSVQP